MITNTANNTTYNIKTNPKQIQIIQTNSNKYKSLPILILIIQIFLQIDDSILIFQIIPDIIRMKYTHTFSIKSILSRIVWMNNFFTIVAALRNPWTESDDCVVEEELDDNYCGWDWEEWEDEEAV